MTANRVIVLGSKNFAGSRIMDALDAGGWASPIDAEANGEPLDPSHKYGIVNAAFGDPKLIRHQAVTALRIAQKAGPNTRLVHMSSMTVYGAVAGLVDEAASMAAAPGAYAAAQIEAERIVHEHPNTVTLRLGCEYGPGCPQWTDRIAHLLRRHRLGDLGVAGDGVCNLLFIEDLVAATLAALQVSDIQGEIFNLGMRSPPTWNEYFIQFGIALRAVPIRRVPSWQVAMESKLLAAPLKIWESIASRCGVSPRLLPPPITPSLIQTCAQQIELDVRKAESRLHMSWTPLAEGIDRTSRAILAGTGPNSSRR